MRSKMLRMSDLPDDLISAWLREEDHVNEVGKPTLRTLVTHLKNIGQSGLARDILTSNGSCVFGT